MRRRLAPIVALVVSACTGWRVQSGPVAAAKGTLEGSKVDAIRVRLTDGREFYIVEARVQGDSLVGYTRDRLPEFTRIAFPVNEVRDVASFGVDRALTAALVAVSVAASVGLIAACVTTASSSY